MIGAYFDSGHFAYPGWRLTVPGGPAGGHYKGFTHTESAGTDIPPQDTYEQDREDGMSSHDCAHATPQQPRGVYRSSAEVPPRPNASGSAHTYRSFQTKRHAGTSVSPGSFPGLVESTGEDDFLGVIPAMMERNGNDPARPNVIQYAPPPTIHVPQIAVDTATYDPQSHIMYFNEQPASGATSVVRQSPPTPLPAPPSPAVQVTAAPPVSPQPAPVVATNEVVPTSDGSLVNTSTGQVVPASQVTQNPATGQLTASSALASAESWLEQSTIFPSIPNWGIVAAAAGLLLLMGKSAHR